MTQRDRVESMKMRAMLALGVCASLLILCGIFKPEPVHQVSVSQQTVFRVALPEGVGAAAPVETSPESSGF